MNNIYTTCSIDVDLDSDRNTVEYVLKKNIWNKILPNFKTLSQICDWEGAEEAEQETFNAWVEVTYDQGLFSNLLSHPEVEAKKLRS